MNPDTGVLFIETGLAKAIHEVVGGNDQVVPIISTISLPAQAKSHRICQTAMLNVEPAYDAPSRRIPGQRVSCRMARHFGYRKERG
jgi:hypothetical protein